MLVSPKGKKLDSKVDILKGLAHPVRIAIAEMLDGREICACEIAEYFRVDRTTVSKHLALMTNLGILKARREGTRIFYTLRMQHIASALACIDGVIERGRCRRKD